MCDAEQLHQDMVSGSHIGEPVMRLSSVAIVALVVGASSPAYVSIALAAPECSRSMELADWGENSTGDISIASGESCIFPITLRGVTSSSEISQKPAHGKLKSSTSRLTNTRRRPDTKEMTPLPSGQQVRGRRLLGRRSS